VESPRGIVTQQQENLFRVESPRNIVTRQEEDLVGVDKPCGIVTEQDMNMVGVAGASELGLVGELEEEVVCQDNLRVALVRPNNEAIPLEASENVVETTLLEVKSDVPARYGSDAAGSSRTMALKTKVPQSAPVAKVIGKQSGI
jgi:hypothetical protein